MIFTSSIREGFISSSMGQYLSTNSRAMKDIFGQKQLTKMEEVFKKTWKRLLMSMKGARHLETLREKMISQSDTHNLESFEGLNKKISDLANQATQKMGRSGRVNRPGQPVHTDPMWGKCSPCAKCAAIQQFSTPLPSNALPPFSVYKIHQCAEDAWELKRILILRYTAALAERKHRGKKRRRLMARFDGSRLAKELESRRWNG